MPWVRPFLLICRRSLPKGGLETMFHQSRRSWKRASKRMVRKKKRRKRMKRRRRVTEMRLKAMKKERRMKKS